MLTAKKTVVSKQIIDAFAATYCCVAETWAQFGGGHGGRVPPTFSYRGDIICHVPPTFFSLGFAFGEVSNIKVMKVMFVTFRMKRF